MSDWQHYNEMIRFNFEGYREGWRGVWDHMLEVLLRRNPRLIPHWRPVRLSFWVRGEHLELSELKMYTDQL